MKKIRFKKSRLLKEVEITTKGLKRVRLKREFGGETRLIGYSIATIAVLVLIMLLVTPIQ